MTETTTQANFRAGIAFFLLAWLIVPVMDGAAKYLGELGYPVLMIAWVRFFLGFLIAVPFVAWRGEGDALLPPTETRWLHTVRAVMLVLATVLFFTAIQTLPIADALAIYFVYPFIVTSIAPVMLGEKTGLRRWLGVGVGFLGSLIVIRPGFGEMDPGVAWCLMGAMAFAVYNLLTRRLAGASGAMSVLAYQGLVGAVVLSPALFVFWKTPEEILAFALFGVLGVISVVGHYFVILAYQRAPAPVLAPYSYFEIISATFVGFVVFGDFPDPLTWTGIAVIVASGVYISVREGHLKRPPRHGASIR